MIFIKRNILVLSLIMIMSFASVGFASAADITLGFVEWDCAISQTHIVAAVLEEHFSMNVDLISVDAGVMWTGLAGGDLDAIVCAWLPVTHGFYWDEYKENLIDLGPNFHGAKIGLVVPEYVEFDSIEQMNSNARDFRSMIYGIDPGAGIMAATDEAIVSYGLNYNVLDSSSAAMVMQLDRAIDKEEPIIVTGWVPHWKFDAYDLKFLDDPQNIYGDSETINTVLNENFKSKFSEEVVSFFDNFYLNQDQLHEMMNIIRMESGSDLELAHNWIAANDDVVQGWLK